MSLKEGGSALVKADIKKAVAIMDTVREEACKNLEYGFNMGWKDFMWLMRLLTPQSSGLRIQNYIFRRFGWEKVPASLNKGDVRNSLGQCFEVKASVITPSNRGVNAVQIRLWQKTSGYHIFVIDSMNNFKLTHFHLSKSEMEQEIDLCGGPAHGTAEINRRNKNVEMSVRFLWKPEETAGTVYDRWMKRYKQDTDIDKDERRLYETEGIINKLDTKVY